MGSHSPHRGCNASTKHFFWALLATQFACFLLQYTHESCVTIGSASYLKHADASYRPTPPCSLSFPNRPQPLPLDVQGKLDVSDVCPTGRIRDMCYVEAANGGRDGGGSEGSLVTVTSAGGVHVWGVPALEGVSTEGTGAELTVPLLATHSLKVGGWVGEWDGDATSGFHCVLVGDWRLG